MDSSYYTMLPMGQKIWLCPEFGPNISNGQKIMTKSENAAEDSEEETNTIMLTLCNTLIAHVFVGPMNPASVIM